MAAADSMALRNFSRPGGRLPPSLPVPSVDTEGVLGDSGLEAKLGGAVGAESMLGGGGGRHGAPVGVGLRSSGGRPLDAGAAEKPLVSNGDAPGLAPCSPWSPCAPPWVEICDMTWTSVFITERVLSSSLPRWALLGEPRSKPSCWSPGPPVPHRWGVVGRMQPPIIGSDNAVKGLSDLIERVAPSTAAVTILGGHGGLLQGRDAHGGGLGGRSVATREAIAARVPAPRGRRAAGKPWMLLGGASAGGSRPGDGRHQADVRPHQGAWINTRGGRR
ncbi:hypothetical protein MFUL124B02_35505 [Myxococcus fulvus 124B02]|nr:hypothetical protein MFUL124B02_35505 [Myxococcus fulvus 124B02]